MQPIYTDAAPAPAGHYSQGYIHNDMIFVSGQLPLKPDSDNKEDPGDIEQQTRQCLHNVSEILRAAGSNLSKIIKVTVYISDIDLWDRVNKVYAEIFGNHKPARAVVPTRDLHYRYKVEIEAVAVL